MASYVIKFMYIFRKKTTFIYQNFSLLKTKVVEIEMMDALGTVRKYKKSENLSDEFYAVLVNLGCLGVMLSMKLQCEKAFKLEQIEYPAKLEDVRTFI
jgi:L-gulonolactone oxidase